jgi:hypothetical protein
MGVNIYICNGGRIWTMYLPIEDIPNLIKTLDKHSNKPIRLQCGSDTAYQYLDIPKWAQFYIRTELGRLNLF